MKNTLLALYIAVFSAALFLTACSGKVSQQDTIEPSSVKIAEIDAKDINWSLYPEGGVDDIALAEPEELEHLMASSIKRNPEFIEEVVSDISRKVIISKLDLLNYQIADATKNEGLDPVVANQRAEEAFSDVAYSSFVVIEEAFFQKPDNPLEITWGVMNALDTKAIPYEVKNVIAGYTADRAINNAEDFDTEYKIAELVLGVYPDVTGFLAADLIRSREAQAEKILALAERASPGSLPVILQNIIDAERYLPDRITMAAISVAPELETEIRQIAGKTDEPLTGDKPERTREEWGFIASLCSGNSERYLLKHVEAVSRDYYYIQLPEKRCSVEFKSIVGGEHMTYYRLLGFSGEQYRIGIEALSGVPFVYLEGDGFKVAEEKEDNDYFDVTVEQDAVWVDISVSASSFTCDYLLIIEKTNLLE